MDSNPITSHHFSPQPGPLNLPHSDQTTSPKSPSNPNIEQSSSSGAVAVKKEPSSPQPSTSQVPLSKSDQLKIAHNHEAEEFREQILRLKQEEGADPSLNIYEPTRDEIRQSKHTKNNREAHNAYLRLKGEPIDEEPVMTFRGYYNPPPSGSTQRSSKIKCKIDSTMQKFS